MSTINTLIATLRTDLHDEDALNYRWTAGELDRHLQRAIAEYQVVAPIDVSKDITALADTFAYVLTGGDAIAGLVDIERVEYPADSTPPVYVPWEMLNTA
ncbi:MAG: hypothetical protein ACYC4L_15255, partial [Chloroflexota bacterium]